MIKVYVTDLEAYNNGLLVGNWYKLPMTSDELAECIEDVLREGKQACRHSHFHEEHFITDFESDVLSVNEHQDIYKLNEMAEALENLNEEEQQMVKFLLDNYLVSNFDEAIQKYDDVRVYSDSSMEDIAYDYVNECYNLDEIAPIITNNIDYEKIGRDLEIEGAYYKVGSDIYEYIG